MTTVTQITPKQSEQPTTSATLDLASLKIRQQAAWSSGNYAVVGTTLQIVGEELCEALDLRAGCARARRRRRQRQCHARRGAPLVRRHLDRLCARAARARPRARRGRRPVDRVPGGRRREPAVRRRQLRRGAVHFRRDVHAEPGQGGRRDAARLQAAAAQIGLANWTPEGFIGQLFKTLGKYLPPPAGAKSPALWGTRARLTELFGSEASSIKAEPRTFNFRYRSPEHLLDVFRTFYGPS